MTDERSALDELAEPDEEELRSAEALARALDGGRAEPGLPEDALQAAALLRLGAGVARLGEQRQREIREQLLGSLPAPAPRPTRASWFGWLLLLVPGAGAAAALVLWLSTGADEGAAPVAARAEQAPLETRGAPGASARTAAPQRALAGAARAFEATGQAARGTALDADARRTLGQGLARDALELRRVLLARSGDGALVRAHAELDAAHGRAALARSQRTLTDLAQTLGGDAPEGDERLLRQDLYCRLAETSLRLGQPRAALEWTQRGLALDGAPTPFLAQLEALEGDAWVALGDDDRAAQGYMKALEVHEKLLDENLDGR